MKVTSITQAPFGTIISLDDNVPSGILERQVTFDDGKTFYEIKGTPSNRWTEILIDRSTVISLGDKVIFVSKDS